MNTKQPPLNITFDAVEWCPVRCPSCPQGRRDVEQKGALLKPEMMERILATVAKQATINRVTLFRWGEPLLNPQLPDLITIGKRYGRTYISTTGVARKCDLGALVKAEPDVFIVATSGMTQPVYETTHPGCTVEKFTALLEELHKLHAKNIFVAYHRYNNNMHEEKLARDLTRKLGFNFSPLWANHMPVEDLMEGKGNEFLIVPVAERLKIGAKSKDYVCGFQTSQLDVDSLGNVLGCGVAKSQAKVGNLLTDPLEKVLEAKAKFSLCDRCYVTGAYKQACGLDVRVDWASSMASRAGLVDRARHAVECTKKLFWRDWEIPKVDSVQNGSDAK